MSILETEKIDMIGTRPGNNLVKLVVADHLDWEDVDAHCRLLQEKINTYIAFVESGQLAQTTEPPIPPNPQVTIALAVPQQPSDHAMEFLRQVKSFLANIGMGFSIEVHDEE